MKKRNLLRFVFFAAFALAGFLVLRWFLAANLRLSRESCERIRLGMTTGEVALALGGPPTDRGSSPKLTSWRHIKHRLDVVGVDGPGTMRSWQEWIGDGIGIVMGFDDDGKACCMCHFRFEETLLDRIRRVFHLW